MKPEDMKSEDLSSAFKDICLAFKTSDTLEQFMIKLDLMCIDIDTADDIYARYCSSFIKFMPECIDASSKKFSFAKVFECKMTHNDVILPHSFMKMFDIAYGPVAVMKAMSSDGSIIEHRAAYSMELESKLSAMYGINVEHEIFRTLMYEIAREVQVRGK